MFFNEIWYDYPRFSVETNMIRFMNPVEIVGRVHPLCFHVLCSRDFSDKSSTTRLRYTPYPGRPDRG